MNTILGKIISISGHQKSFPIKIVFTSESKVYSNISKPDRKFCYRMRNTLTLFFDRFDQTSKSSRKQQKSGGGERELKQRFGTARDLFSNMPATIKNK